MFARFYQATSAAAEIASMLVQSNIETPAVSSFLFSEAILTMLSTLAQKTETGFPGKVPTS